MHSGRFLSAIVLAVLFAPIYSYIGYNLIKDMQYIGILITVMLSLPVLWLIASYLFDGIY